MTRNNALAESFNATLKREILHDCACWADAATGHREVFRWLARRTPDDATPAAVILATPPTKGP